MSDINFDQSPQKQATAKGGAPLLACYDDLAGSCDYAWAMLARGVKDRKSAFHTPAIATLGADGRPSIRTVVLRGCDVADRHLRFHTDKRSGKISELQAHPQAAMHFYDAQVKIQLRLGVRLETLGPENDAEAYRAAWQATRPMSRECYQVTQAPGAAIGDPHEVHFDAAATQDGEDHFVPVRAHVETIEWLYLAARGHRRALFDFTQDKMSWLVP